MSYLDKSADLLPRILLVDDEQAFGRAVQRHFQKNGYGCEHVFTLEEARRSIASEPPNLLILDMKLPDGNGLNFLKEIERNREFPVFVLTAYATVDTAVAAMKLRACDYLSKPIDLDSMSKLVSLTLENWGFEYGQNVGFPFQTLATMEQTMIKEALRRAKGNVSKAARYLGLGRMALRHRIRKYGIIDDSDVKSK